MSGISNKKYSNINLNNYKKVASLIRLENEYGLDVHKYYIVSNLDELDKRLRELDYICTIRTDISMDNINGYGNDYPFFKISCKDDYNTELRLRLGKVIERGYLCIVTNGLRYDKYLYCNIVFKIDRSGDFIAEYSQVNVPLRHMYKYPSSLYNVSGNILINDTIRNFSFNKYGSISLKLIREFMCKQYEHMIKYPTLYNRYIEASLYNRNNDNIDVAYWEVR